MSMAFEVFAPNELFEEEDGSWNQFDSYAAAHDTADDNQDSTSIRWQDQFLRL